MDKATIKRDANARLADTAVGVILDGGMLQTVPAVGVMSVAVIVEEPTALLASVFCLDADGYTDQLVGRFQRLMRTEAKTYAKNLTADSVGEVLRALLSHKGWHSNRVWSGVERLAKLSGLSPTHVKRVLAFLRSIFVIRNVIGDERTAGPGPHQFPREERKNERKLESNCYDLSGLLPLLSGVLRGAIEEVLAGRTEHLDAARAAPPLRSPGAANGVEPLPYDDVYSDPFADTANVTDQITEPVTIITSGDFADTLATIPVPVSINTSHKVERLTENSPDSCNVGDVYKSSDKRDSASDQAVTDSCFPRPEMAHINRPDAPAYTREEKSEYKRGHTELEAVGVDEGERVRIIRESGVEFALTLALFGEWRRLVGDANGIKIVKLGAYLRQTWSEMEAKRKSEGRDHHEWCEDFLKWKAKRAAPRTTSKSANNIQSGKSAKPICRSEYYSPISSLDSGHGDRSLAALPEPMRSALLAQAQAVVFASPLYRAPGTEKRRLRAIERGFDEPGVRIAAERILHERGAAK